MLSFNSEVLRPGDRPVQKRVGGVNQLRQRRDGNTGWRAIEVGDGEAVVCPVNHRPVNDAREHPIGEDMKEVSNVDNKCTGKRRDGDPSGSLPFNLQTADGVLVEDCEEGGVGVGGETHRPVRLRTRRIEVQL